MRARLLSYASRIHHPDSGQFDLSVGLTVLWVYNLSKIAGNSFKQVKTLRFCQNLTQVYFLIHEFDYTLAQSQFRLSTTQESQD